MSQAGIINEAGGGGGGSPVNTLTGNTGGAVPPTGNNINVVGAGNVTVTGDPGTSTLTITTNDALTDLHVAQYIVSSSGTSGTGANYSTISAALTAAPAGSSIFIQPGTYSENLTISKNINLFSSDDTFGGFTVLSGNITFTGDVIATFNGFRIVDSGVDTIIADGSGKLLLYFHFIEFILTSSVPALSYTNSGQSSITFNNCYYSLPGGSQLFNQSANTDLEYIDCNILSQGTSASTASSGRTLLNYCVIDTPIITSGSNALNYEFNDVETYSDNATMLTIGGSGANRVLNNYISSGTSPCISIGSSCNVDLNTLNSSNINVITGLGTVNLGTNDLIGTGVAVNTSTIIPTDTTLGYVNGTGQTAGLVLTSNLNARPTFQAGASPILTTTFAAGTSGTWTKGANTKYIQIYGWGPGGGGGSGRLGLTTTSGGGGGGSAGGCFVFEGPAQFFGATETYAVGSGGAGGTGQTATTTNGITGSPGSGPTTFGSYLTATAGLGGVGGTATTAAGGAISTIGLITDYSNNQPGTSAGSQGSNTTGSNNSNTTTSLGWFSSGGGGGGSGFDAVTARQAGNGGAYTNAIGPSITVFAVAQGGISSGTINGANGASQLTAGGIVTGGQGGGGGGGCVGGATSGTGGNGGNPGGGGGGGGGGSNANASSGAGGNGGGGLIIIVEFS
jgi:hypothetical protein